MQLVDIHFKNKRYGIAIAENWNELQRKDLLHICRFFLRRTTVIEAKYLLARQLLGFRFGAMGLNKAILAIPHEQFHFFAELLKWVFEPSKLTRCLVKRIRVGLRCYYGPNDGMSYATFDEVVSAYVRQNLFKQANTDEKKLQYLAELCAVLYRPRKWWWPITAVFTDLNTGDCRIPLNEATIKLRAKRLIKAKPELLYASLLFFEGCHAMFESIAPDVFSTKGVGEGSKSKFGWETFYVAMAGEKFGTIHQVGNTYFTSILLELQDKLAKK